MLVDSFLFPNENISNVQLIKKKLKKKKSENFLNCREMEICIFLS